MERPAGRTPVRRTLPGTDGLVWTVARLHRTALWVWAAYVAVSAGLLLWLWGPGSSAAQKAFDAFGYAGAQEDGWAGKSVTLPSIGTSFDSLFYDPATLTRIATVVIAVFAAGPLIARELESGTAQLAWTQSVSPARWLAAKLTLPALAVTVGTGLVVALYEVVWRAHGHLLIAGIGPRSFYFSIGPATIAGALFGLALGVFAALVLRRTLPALAVAGIGTYLVGALRANSWPFQGAYQQPEIPVRNKAITSSGAEISDPQCSMDQKCLDAHHVTGFTRQYLPSSDYWPRQLAETGILLALTALLVVAAFLVLRRYQPKKGATA
ncbi:ABC transporter permease subunit [Streptomyces sp. SID8379]|nr:ABC transporter permease subunit [Streptomyces sp. SID8379]